MKRNRSLYRTCSALVILAAVVGYLGLRTNTKPKAGFAIKRNGSHSVEWFDKLEDVPARYLQTRTLLSVAVESEYNTDVRECEDIDPDEELHELCQNIHLYDDEDYKCDFAERTSYCAIINGFVNYTFFVYCAFKGLEILGTIVMLCWWVFLFVALAVTADDFFCPAMVVIVKTLHLSPNVAGVTFLAFGNGAPDLFSAIVAFLIMRAGDAGMAVGGLFGAGMFVSAFIVGTVAFVKPFKVSERPFLRDDVFYLGACFWMLWIIWREKIFLYDAVGFVMLYIVYVVIVVISGSMYKKQALARQGDKVDEENKEVRLKRTSAVNGFLTSPSSISLTEASDIVQAHTNPSYELDPTDEKADRTLSLEVNVENDVSENADGEYENIEKTANGDLSVQKIEEEDEISQLEPEDMPPWYMQFLYGINPIDIDEWPNMKIYVKIYECFKSPIVLILTLTVPVVKYEDVPLNNWNKYLNVLHCLWSLMICSFLIQFGTADIGGLPIWALLLIIGAAFAVACFFTSVDYRKPKYHEAFGYYAFLVAMVWIYAIATEIVNLLTAFGVVVRLSNGILGLTLLAWGNSVGDFVADMVMARQGFPGMAFAACFGAPIFHLLLGTGIAFIARMAADGVSEFFVRLDTLLFTANISTMLSMLLSLVLLSFLRFRANKMYGIILAVFYVAFVIIAILCEAGVIPEEMR